jgi:uracil-DNA glycosylase
MGLEFWRVAATLRAPPALRRMAAPITNFFKKADPPVPRRVAKRGMADQEGREAAPQSEASELTDEQRALVAKKREEALQKLSAKRAKAAAGAAASAQAAPGAAAARAVASPSGGDGGGAVAPPADPTAPFSDLESTLEPEWAGVLATELSAPYFAALKEFLNAEHRAGKTIFPPRDRVFAAFRYTPLSRVSVVIIGQDPYHGPGQAEGLSFSVPPGVAVPSSLKNMYKELSTDIPGFSVPKHGHLAKWAAQGVLLLNATLTVLSGQPNSHAGAGWRTFTARVIAALNAQPQPIVFLLWGGFAKEVGAKLDRSRHGVFTAAHPSGLSANKGFFGCKHFSKANEFLKQHGREPIDWQV